MKRVGYPDKPVASITEDLFNVEVYVNALCSFIRSCETPMTISIQGDWGSGKTSMMNMMRANLQGTVWPIWFNTWQFSQFDMGSSLAFSMMDVILKGLDCEISVRKRIINGLIGFGKRVIRNVSDYTFGGEITSVISNSLEGAGDVDVASEIMELKGRFSDAVKEKLAKEHCDRVVIFVDDLDRLQPEKAVELLEVLKLFLDCDQCVFVLAVDYEVVTLGIRQKYGNDVSEEKGRSFFDKIIQLPFKMPVASYDIRRYVREMKAKIDGDSDDEVVDLYYNLIRTSVGFNPRSMKRMFNTYELLDIVTQSTVRNIDEKVRKRILFAIICTQMCYEKLYLYFTSTRIDEDTFVALHAEDSMEAAIKEIYGADSEGNLFGEIQKLKSFMPYFERALQTDSSGSLTAAEVASFKAILKCSMVTSVNAKEEEIDSDSREWEYRNINKELVKEAAEKLKDIGSFSAWMPRKAREGVKFSDISGWYSWNTAAGFTCTLEYYLSRVSEYIIGVDLNITLRDSKGLEKQFFDALGDNPLKSGVLPQKEEWGRYIYNNILRLNANDPSSADQIASLTRNAYVAVVEQTDKYQKQNQEG
ncbi:MAG: KAP family NTPase [Lachnospiraceae bacterium]|nr:KAP family NTPase [Lachnospiraceae bacterium]